MTTLPESIGNLTQLIILYLYNNKINTLPKSIGNCNQLSEYSLNEITKLKNKIENNLKIIKDQHNKYFNNNVFEELIIKSMHPSRMSQFMDCEYD